MNMGYCRFQNTVKDLRNCRWHIEDSDLSEEEAKARFELLDLCLTIVEENDLENTIEDWRV